MDCATKWSFESVPVNLWLSTQTCPDQLNVWPTASATLDFRQCGRCALNVELLSTHWTSVILIWLRAPHRHLYPGLMSIFINPGESTDSGITREIRIGPPENNVKPDGILINFQPLGDLQLSPLPAVRANTVSIYPHWLMQFYTASCWLNVLYDTHQNHDHHVIYCYQLYSSYGFPQPPSGLTCPPTFEFIPMLIIKQILTYSLYFLIYYIFYFTCHYLYFLECSLVQVNAIVCLLQNQQFC